MSEKFYSLLTNIGKAKIANSVGLGTKINFSIMKVGDGGGSYYDPTEDQTDLKNVVWQGNINHVEIDEENPNWINIEVMIPSTVGGFTIREYGAFDEEGNMLGICKCAETYKPVIADGSTKELLLNLVLAISNTSTVSLKVDPTIIFAKKSEVEQLRADINTQLSDMVYQIAGGSATAITLAIKGTLVNGYPITFIASANNGGAATTINGKKLYKPGTTTSPNLISGKAYTVWYKSTGDCFFIKASAEGDADVSHVLATKKFSNDNDTGLTGTMPNNGAVSSTLTNNNQEYTIPAGFHNGLGKIKAIITNLAAAVVKAGTTVGGIVGTFTADATAVAADIISGKTAYVNGNKITGNATIESLGGMNVATGTAISSTDRQTYTTISGSNSGGHYITVTGLAFMPSIIICYYGDTYIGNTVVYTNQSGIIKAFPISSGDTGNWFYTTASPTSITSTGFSIPIGNISTVSNKTYTWIALG
ncbi:phage tail protein [Clostridium beijerinckii]|uniref:phage tail protein n=1 Tax=Clostridium beijerinckii TaxID=1520 RepID=UPI002227B147|nr:phage tail protein [Clostridium beijerinckii]UYZ37285.1 phage tail protein [Clostridium beijerinckii]